MNMGNVVDKNDEVKNLQQEQTQLNKQILSLKQDQNSSNSIMCKILSELENLAIDLGFEGKKTFAFYSTKSKDRKAIVDQILLQMTIFESSYKKFVKKHPNKKYEYPDNLKLSEIKEIVNKWKESIKNNESNKIYLSYYDEFLNILSDKDLSQQFNDEFEKIDTNSENITNTELKRVMNAASMAVCYNNEKNNEIEEEINKKGDYKVNVVLNGERNDNTFFKNMDKYDEKLSGLKKELYKHLDLILGYLEIYTILNATSENNLNIRYANNLLNKDLEKKIFAEYSKLLTNYQKIENQLYEEFSFVLPKEEKDKIKTNIEKWIQNINKEGKEKLDEALKCICEEESLK